jgi:hypothetical protein
MKKIYLILAHKSPEQLERQIRALTDEQAYFYIHVDLKSDINLFRKQVKMDRVIFIEKRVDCIWGDFSIIIATLNLIEAVIKNHSDGFCILMSGNDYPIKSKCFINSFIAQNADKVFIDIIEAENLWLNFDERTEKYKINLSSKRDDFLLLKGLNKQLLKCLIKKNINFKEFIRIIVKKPKLNLKIKFYGGSQWWAMNILNLHYIYNFINSNKNELYDFFIYTLCPDEFFFHSILMYLVEIGNSFKIESSITYVNWNRKGVSLPVTFNINDFCELIEQPANKLFARKFDIEFDKSIIDKIDKNII